MTDYQQNQNANAIFDQAQNKIINSKGIELGSQKSAKEDDFIVHNMPDKFRHAHHGGKKAKNTGIIILIFGSMTLVGVLLFLYSYFTNSDKGLTIKKEEDTITAKVKIPVPKINKTNPIVEEDSDGPAAERSNSGFVDEEGSDQEESGSNGAVDENDPNTAGKNEPASGNEENENGKTNATSTLPIDSAATGTTKVINASSTSLEEEVESRRVEYRDPPDSDGDKLGDMEELILDCNIQNSDSDGDGYDDFSELANLFNPAGKGEIILNPNIEKYENTVYGYSVLYPKNWTMSQVGNSESVIFRASNNHFIQAISLDMNGQNFDDWILKQLNIDSIAELKPYYKKGWAAYIYDNELTVYLYRPGVEYAFVIIYNTVQDNVLYFDNLYKLIIKSMELID